jgi:V/A-type H+-transporting ATPase subunit F
MEFFCIGDEDTVRGFRLAGVEGLVVKNAGGAAAALAAAVSRPDCGVILITSAAAGLALPQLEELRLERARPLVVEI